ncbi:MAG: ABC transporter permease [Epsilonproteobacteria bacterium]|nr:ABC transporter permease [Campylobacterota bacterium]MBD3838759.1 ABC transporter permease [Campylobacterota bacterium]
MEITKPNQAFINKIIKHYLRYDKDNPFIFVSAILAFLGITAGVMVLMLAMGIMNGTQQEFQKRLFVMNYPITLLSLDGQIDDKFISNMQKSFPNLKFSPYYTTGVMSTSESNVNGSILYGVDFEKESQINEVFAKANKKSKLQKTFKIIAGAGLLTELDLKTGEKMTLYFFSEKQAFGFITMPVQKSFMVANSFDSGLKAYDKAILYTTLEAFQRILKKEVGHYDGVHIFSTQPMMDIEKLKQFVIQNGMGEKMMLQGWWEENISFFAAMEMEKKALFLVLLLIILVASLNIISSLLMTVMSRRSEIALMLTLGATQKEIKSIFFRLGVIIGVSGIIAGTILGFFGMWVLDTFPIISLPEDVYGFSKLPVDLKTIDFIFIISGTFVIVLLSSLYPASKASKTDVLSVLRNE